MRYDYAQLERLWLDAGGGEDQMSRAAATAEAESRGNPDAAYPGQTIAPGSGTWDDATGLWQILGAPAGDWKASELTDPLQNAKMAVAKYDQAGGWSPWAGDDWRHHLRQNVPPAQSVPGGGGQDPVPYQNPLRDVQNLTPERIDMGVDYSGTGPVHALGPGVITATGNSGWPAGNFIAERLTAGPARGRYAYVAEDITPDVQVGQRVDSSTIIGQMFDGGSGIETGWAAPPGTGNTLAAEAGQASTSGDPGEFPTAYGVAYSKLLKWLGAPPGVTDGPVTGSVPRGWFDGGQGDAPIGVTGSPVPPDGGGGGGGLFGLGDIGSALSSIAGTIEDAEKFVHWFMVPNHWVRIGCGIGGSFFVAWGLWSMSRTGRAYSASVPVAGKVPVPEGGQLAPALGIASVTIGAVLLFFTFHGLPTDVTDFGSFASFLQNEVKGGGQGASA